MIAGPTWSDDVQAAAISSGENPSRPSDSPDQASV
jgi:hypothetical protein